jgi:Asp-tRNA(Asn)/Glu-tRNA(Gln) amidotransferase A subunit family amidase
MNLIELSASAAIAAIDAGQTNSQELVQAYIHQINAYE